MTAPLLPSIPIKSLLIAAAIGLATLLSGCAPVFLVGAGVGAGAYTYIKGNLTRVYEADYQQSIRASVNAMEQLNFKRKEESTEQIKTIIEGYLHHDTPVTIEVVYIDDGWTKIGVRTGYIGVDNLEISEKVHTDIAERLTSMKQPTLKKALTKQKDRQAETKPSIPRTQYDKLPPPPKTDGSSTISLTDDGQTYKDEQVQLSLFPTESKTKAFIYYRKTTVAIPPGSYGALDEIISQLNKKPSAMVDIRGYTDSSGSKSKNLALSEKRAFEIRNYLIDKGIAEERIKAQGLGATNFLESNRTERLRSLNRRVEIVIR